MRSKPQFFFSYYIFCFVFLLCIREHFNPFDRLQWTITGMVSKFLAINTNLFHRTPIVLFRLHPEVAISRHTQQQPTVSISLHIKVLTVPACRNSSLFIASGSPPPKETYLSSLTPKQHLPQDHSTPASPPCSADECHATAEKRPESKKADDDRGAAEPSESGRWLSRSGGLRNTNASLP